MEEAFSSLNNEQREAVTTTEGFVRVIAGAGSGKTRALTQRFAYLVNDIGVLPGNILCVTFTNKAAAEMRQRIRKLTGDNDTGYISTFHSFCVTVLQEDSNAVQYPKSFLVLDNSDIDAMLQIIYEERGLTLRQMTFGNARDMIEIRKILRDPDYYNDMIGMSLEALHQKYRAAEKPSDIIFYGYLYQEKKCFALDYNDLLKFVLYIFQTDPVIKLKWQQRLEYIMIDEFQDIDRIQYELMEVLCGYHRNLFIVGDPDQTIYTWRGADVHYLLDFDQHFPGTHTVMMNRNYRSTPQIVNAANSLISRNTLRIKKDLSAILPAGPQVLYHHAKTTDDEALWIAGRIRLLTDGGIKAGDIALLYRAHYLSRPLEAVFSKEKIPFTMYSGIQFFDREEIKDALSYLRMIAYRDDLSFRRIVNKPRRNIGKSRIAFLEQYAAENSCSLYESLRNLVETEQFAGTKAKQFIALIEHFTPEAEKKQASELLGEVIDAAGYEIALRTEGNQTRLDNLAELKQSMYEFENSCGEECTLAYYLAHAALLTGFDAGSSENAVKLMTVHTAKGLEFPHVFICGLDEGVFPSKKVRDRPAMEEERRLAFVALTRAQKTLTLTDAEGRNLDGSLRYPSRFIFDVDRTYLAYDVELDESFTKGARSCIAMSESGLESLDAAADFAENDRVRHAILGTGTITGMDYNHKAYLIKFDTIPTPRSISFRVKLVHI
jgi:DNA helicase II / ATP-dependent DNA helicase PcrA